MLRPQPLQVKGPHQSERLSINRTASKPSSKTSRKQLVQGQARAITKATSATPARRAVVAFSSEDSPAGDSADDSKAAAATGTQEQGKERNKKWLVGGSVVTGAAVILGIAIAMGTPQGAILKELLVNGPLGKSGFLAAFSLIFLSEIGDKTFFIAALLAAKLGKWISFSGSLSSLSLMSIVSVAIGAIFSRVPDALKSTLPIGEVAGVILLAVFGIRALKEGLQSDDASANEGAEEELAEANEAVSAAEQGGRMRRTEPVKAFFEVASLVFIAEWGDRSMLATIALGAAQNPVGVASGAVMGHAIATGLAVLGGALASKYINEKTISIVGGALFLLFAAATAYSLL